MNPPPALPSDRQLLDAARRGDRAAWAELLQRHRVAVERIAGTGRAAARRVDQALVVAEHRLVQVEPSTADAADIRAVRPALVAALTDGFYGPAWPGVLSDASNDAPAGAAPAIAPPPATDAEMLAVAFATLPEPWQTALWHRWVEREDDAAISPYVGRPADDVDELVATARRGLIDAFLREYQSAGPFRPDGAHIVPLLAGYATGSLPDEQRSVVDTHLRNDRIAVADPPAPPPGDLGTATPSLSSSSGPSPDGSTGSSPGSSPHPLAPPTLRRHDAVDSRRLLELFTNLHTRFADAIAPGVLSMPADPDATNPPPQPTSAVAAGRSAPSTDAEQEHRRRRLAAVAASLLVVVAIVAGIVLIGSGGDNDASPDPASPTGTDEPGSTPGSSDPDPDAGGGGADPDDGVAPTTSLNLRPDPEGPLSTISVVVDPAAEPLGIVATPAASVSVVGSFPAPVLAGGSGTIDLAVTNAGGADTVVGLTLQLPSGVRFDAGEGGVCEDPDDDSPRCTVEVTAGATVTVSARVLLERAVIGRLAVDGDLVEPVVADITAIPDLVHSSVGRGDVVVVGNTVTRCAPGPARAEGIDCGAVADGTGGTLDRWDVPIEFVGGNAAFGLFNASSAELVIPEGATILAAHLFWAGDLEQGGLTVPDDDRNTTIALGLPGGRVRTIEAGRVVLGDVDASQYLGSNDVTELVRAGGSGEYTVGNVHTVDTRGSFGAWALAVVYDHPEAPRRQRLVTRPFDWVAPADGENERYEYAVDIPIPLDGTVAGELDVFGLEGELGFSPERFTAGDQVLGGDNPFDSSITGERTPSEINNLGVDIDTYALDIDASTGILPLRVTSEFDGVRIAVLGLTVDLPT